VNGMCIVYLVAPHTGKIIKLATARRFAYAFKYAVKGKKFNLERGRGHKVASFRVLLMHGIGGIHWFQPQIALF